MAPRWKTYANMADVAVDKYFGEDVLLLPYTKPAMSAAVPDATRAITEARAAEFTMATSPMSGAQGEQSKEIEADLVLSLQQRYIDTANLRQYDRVQMLDRDNLIMEVQHIEPDAMGRPKLHMLRIKEP